MPPLCSHSSAGASVSVRLNIELAISDFPVYIFIGSVTAGGKWYQFVPGAIIGVIGIGYVVLEYIPSIEPPANMRYVFPGA